MSDFTVIETQEQLDKIIGERIKRAEAKAEEKYADYADLKKKNEAYVRQLTQLTDQVKEQSDTISAHEATVADLNAKIHQYEMDSVKIKVANALGLPYQMASRLTGDDEASIRADGEAMAMYVKSINQPAPFGGGGDPGNGSTRDHFASIMSEALN